MENASSTSKSKLSWIPLLIAILWTVLIAVLVIGTATTPDDYGFNGAIIMGLFIVWLLGVALGLGVRAVVCWWRRPPRRR